MKAYRAWKELDMKILNGQRLTLRPSENNVGVISKNRNSLFELAVEGLHPELLMVCVLLLRLVLAGFDYL